MQSLFLFSFLCFSVFCCSLVFSIHRYSCETFHWRNVSKLIEYFLSSNFLYKTAHINLIIWCFNLDRDGQCVAWTVRIVFAQLFLVWFSDFHNKPFSSIPFSSAALHLSNFQLTEFSCWSIFNKKWTMCKRNIIYFIAHLNANMNISKISIFIYKFLYMQIGIST